MNLGEALIELRDRLDDIAEPYLWSNERLVQYIEDAQAEAADRARLILDDESPLTRFTTEADKALYRLDPAILNVEAVLLDGFPLERNHEQWLDEHRPRWRSDTGHPLSFIEREDGKHIRLHPTPQSAVPVQMQVYRLPREPLAADDLDAEFEIHERHHMRMLDWAARLAYLKRDADTEDRRRADTHEAFFIESFGIRRDANVQRKQRPRRVPTVTPSW